jgi:hypothetical protein
MESWWMISFVSHSILIGQAVSYTILFKTWNFQYLIRVSYLGLRLLCGADL